MVTMNHFRVAQRNPADSSCGLREDLVSAASGDRRQHLSSPPLIPSKIRRGRRAHSLPKYVPAPSGRARRAAGTPFSQITLIGNLERSNSSTSEVRRSLRRLMAQLDVPMRVEFDVVLAAGEVVTNAVRYGKGDQIQWTAAASSNRIVVEMEYATDRFETMPEPESGASMSEHGRGLTLMRALMDQVHFRFQRGHVRIILIKNWATD